MNVENLKKNLFFIFIFYFPVQIIVYYFESFYLIVVDHEHFIHILHSFPTADIVICFGFFGFFFLANFLNKFLIDKNINQLWVPFFYGCLVCFLCTFFELIVGLFYIYVFDQKFWDYSSYPYNFKGIIAPKISFIWFLLGVFYYSYLHKKVLKIKILCDEKCYMGKQKNKIEYILLFCVWCCHVGDFGYNMINWYHFNKNPSNKGLQYRPLNSFYCVKK